MPSPSSNPPPPGSGSLVITEVRIIPQENGALKAFASITLNDSFVVRGLKVIDGNHGRFVAMPSRRRRDGTYQDIAHPINQKFRSYMESVVLSAFEELPAVSVPDGGGEDEAGFES